MPSERYLPEHLPAIPELAVPAMNLEDLKIEFLGFHDYFADCFTRLEPRNNFLRYMIGQFNKAGSSAVDFKGFSATGGKRSLQRFVSDGAWDELLLLNRYQRLVHEDLGDVQGVCLFAEACFPKKGQVSAGVARQYCCTMGRIVNCQIGIFAGYASVHGYALLDKRLFVPEPWFGEGFLSKRQKSAIPEALRFKSKAQLVLEILNQLHGNGGIPFKYLVIDHIADSSELTATLEEYTDLVYLVAVAADASFRFDSSPVGTHAEANREHCGESVSGRFTEPIAALEFAKNQNDFFWYRRSLSLGSEGEVEYEFTRTRVMLAPDGLSEKGVWLLARRTLDREPRYTFFISNAPPQTGLSRLIWLSGVRWAMRRCLRESGDHLAMGDYEVRKYAGWNRHMLTCMLAHFFLTHRQVRLGQKSSFHYLLPL